MGTPLDLAIFQKPIFQRVTGLRVPSGASAYHRRSCVANKLASLFEHRIARVLARGKPP